jgi:hypothetical protein
MSIACLGWGSLIWDPRTLPLKGSWKSDGPTLPIEFARESNDGRITLVLVDAGRRVNSLWTLLELNNIETAKLELAKRERITGENIKYSVGFWDKASNVSFGKYAKEIENWALQKDLDGVVWTNLKYGLKDSRDVMPDSSQVVSHLRNLPDDQRSIAEEYIRKTPMQVNTEYRQILETELGWLPANENA